MKSSFKKIAMIIVFGLSSLSSSAQQIVGLGEFKIGMSIRDFIDWTKNGNIEVNEIRTSDYKKGKIIEEKNIAASKFSVFIPLPTVGDASKDIQRNNITFDINYTSDYDLFYVDKYSVDNISIGRVELIFYKNELIRIGANNLSENLKDALNAKFGKAIEKIELKPYTCVYKISGAIAKKDNDISTTYSWKSAKNIKASGVLAFGHLDSCTIFSASWLVVERIEKNIDFDKANNKARKKIETEIEHKKQIELKKQLDNL